MSQKLWISRLTKNNLVFSDNQHGTEVDPFLENLGE